MSRRAEPLTVLADASALADGRRTAGIGRYVSSLLAALAERDDVVVHRYTPRRPPPRDSWALRWLHAQPGLVAASLRHRPRLVHGMASDPALGWPLERQVVTVHDVIPWTETAVRPGSVTARYLAFQRRRFRRCAAVIAVSDAVAAEACAALQLEPRTVEVVPEGVGAVFTAAADRRDHELRAVCGVTAAGYVLWVGSMRAHDHRKALDVLLDAVTSVGGDGPALTLVLAGASGAESQRLAATAAARGRPVILTGYVDDPTLAALYRGAAAVALPSRHEGFGLPLLEAMACGAPVVAGAAGNLPELAGDAALLVPPGDARSLAQALLEVLSDAAVRARLAVAGPRRAASFTWARAAEQTVAVYRRAARAQDPASASP